jgi:hypothetical protein
MKRLKGDGKAVGLKVDEVAVGGAGLAAGGDVGAAGLLDGDGDCWSIVSLMLCLARIGSREELTDRDAEAVQANEVLAAVAAGDLLAVTADGLAGLGVDVDIGVLVRSTTGGGSDDNGGHGGDDERLEEGHFGSLVGLVGGVGKRVWCWVD